MELRLRGMAEPKLRRGAGPSARSAGEFDATAAQAADTAQHNAESRLLGGAKPPGFAAGRGESDAAAAAAADSAQRAAAEAEAAAGAIAAEAEVQNLRSDTATQRQSAQATAAAAMERRHSFLDDSIEVPKDMQRPQSSISAVFQLRTQRF